MVMTSQGRRGWGPEVVSAPLRGKKECWEWRGQLPEEPIARWGSGRG